MNKKEEAARSLAFAQELKLGGKYWVLEVNGEHWPNIIAHNVWHLMPDEAEEGELEAAYYLSMDEKEHYFLSKDFIPSTVLAKMLGVSVGDIYEADIIVLNDLPVIGDPDAKPTVGYFGEA